MHQEGEEIIARIKAATDIISLVDGYIPLKPRGKNYVALCPFHEEKSPSFNVNPERQTFKCFGCGKSGDVLTFVQEMEKVDFPEAKRMLAEQAGIALKGYSRQNQDDKQALRQAVTFAVDFYRKCLREKEGAGACDYLKKRGLTGETAKEFGLGFAPQAWDRLKAAAEKAGFTHQILERAGLLKRNEQGRLYDRLRHRITIPIYDNQNRPVGFGGRVLNPDDEPKYLNSPDGPLFNKSELLYGLHFAKKHLGDDDKIYIVEGYTDVILAHQAGVRNVVAALGTSFTRGQAKLLRRFVSQVIFVFDGDEAGQNASTRGIELLLEEDLDVSVVILPENVDPADVAAREGREGLERALSREVGFFDFVLDRLGKKIDLTSMHGKGQAADTILSLVLKVPNAVKQDFIFQRIADRLDVNEKTLRERFHSLLEKRAARVPEKTVELRPVPKPRDIQLERELLSVLLFDSSLLPAVRQTIRPESFSNEGYGEIYKEMLKLYDDGRAVDLAGLMELTVGNPHQSEVASWQDTRYEEPQKTALQLLEAFRRREGKSRIRQLKEKTRNAGRSNNEAEADDHRRETFEHLREMKSTHG